MIIQTVYMLIANAYLTFMHTKYLVYMTQLCNLEHVSLVWVLRCAEALLI